VTTGAGRADELIAELVAAGVGRNSLLGLAVSGTQVGLAGSEQTWTARLDQLAEIEHRLRPRWVWWSIETPIALVRAGIRVAACWDVAAVHRLIAGGHQARPGVVWAALNGLDGTTIPTVGQLDLLGHLGDDGGDPEDPVRPDGHLRPEWASGWERTPQRLARWAATARAAQHLQLPLVKPATAVSESAAELLCAELTVAGLPLDRDRAEQLIAAAAGPRPRDDNDAAQLRRRRDDEVLRHVPTAAGTDLRNPAQVKAMLLRAGIDVPNTRSWRLEPFVGAHPVVEALLAWRKAERIATTYGYQWLADSVGPDGRLRGTWSGSDGAAGRMTASAGLHNLPAPLRPAVAADEGWLFVRADLGQIEPRVLAAVSGDQAFARAAAEDDLYAPVAAALGVDRPVAKIAVLAAMYGQTSGAAGQALRDLERAYPVAMRYLLDAAESGRAGRDVFTFGGRRVRMWQLSPDLDEEGRRSAAAGRGRYARNAVVQGAAAEFFKAWAATVRARVWDLDASVVLCLHDELLVHSPAGQAETVAARLLECLDETAARWAPPARVRFVADVSIVRRWSEAKQAAPAVRI
jgi:DNA polymerase-1